MASCLRLIPIEIKPRFSFHSSRNSHNLPRRPSIIVSSVCLNAPLEPRSPAGKFLTGVLLDDRDNFTVAARRELERISLQRNEAVARSQIINDSSEAVLHRRIAHLKEQECGLEIEDIIYASILHKFMEMRVYLVPPLSQCVCNNRLEIYPKKDCELESIHSIEALEMVKDHINSIIGNRAYSSVKQSWTTTLMPLSHLRNLYNSSIFYGYFLKSASYRHTLEASSCCIHPSVANYVSLGRIRVGKSWGFENLKSYVMRFKQESVEMIAKPRSKEGVNVIKRQCSALFGDDDESKCGLVGVSFASVKRLALEAVGFGSFLWDAEKLVSSVYVLVEN